MPKTKIDTNSLVTAIGTSVLQWGEANGFGDTTVSEFYQAITRTKGAKASKSKAPKGAKRKAKTATTTAKTAKAPKGAPKKKKTSGATECDPAAVVKFIKKHEGAKAADLKGLIPENPNARSLFMKALIEDNKIRREGAARGTTYYPV